ncbi:MAG: efflux RND transporter periplasmic adaptor subunit [Deltaproteobacteria bacterium]|nr:efflux RND transporter periplasmic adaptor subunit [Deltaproteobacteria bacterium]
MKKKRLIFVVAGGIAAVIVASAVFFSVRSNGFDAPAYKIIKAAKGELRIEVLATGVVVPETEVVVKSKAGGEITRFPFHEGDLLEKGVVVARLDPKTELARKNQAEANLLVTQARLNKARISYKDADMRLKRQNKLFEDGIISRQDLDDAEIAFEKAGSDVKIAEAELSQSQEALNEERERLADTEIKAPFTGTMLRKFVDAGQVISSSMSSFSDGTQLFSMANLEKIYVDAMVDEVDIGRVIAGQEASATIESLPGVIFSGTVERISPKGEVQRTVTVFKVFVRVNDKNKAMLRPGMTADVRILAGLSKDSLLIPNEALKLKNGKSGIYVLAGDEPAWREIKTGKTDGLQTEVTSGLKEGEIVVTSGMINDAAHKAQRRRFVIF